MSYGRLFQIAASLVLGAVATVSCQGQSKNSLEGVAAMIVEENFSSIEELEEFLVRKNIDFELYLEDFEPTKKVPKDNRIEVDPKDPQYVLVFTERVQGKIFRFVVFKTKAGLHLEDYSGHKNPYQL